MVTQNAFCVCEIRGSKDQEKISRCYPLRSKSKVSSLGWTYEGGGLLSRGPQPVTHHEAFFGSLDRSSVCEPPCPAPPMAEGGGASCSPYAAAAAAKALQLCPTLCNPIDGSPPGSPVPGTLQARTAHLIPRDKGKFRGTRPNLTLIPNALERKDWRESRGRGRW